MQYTVHIFNQVIRKGLSVYGDKSFTAAFCTLSNVLEVFKAVPLDASIYLLGFLDDILCVSNSVSGVHRLPTYPLHSVDYALSTTKLTYQKETDKLQLNYKGTPFRMSFSQSRKLAMLLLLIVPHSGVETLSKLYRKFGPPATARKKPRQHVDEEELTYFTAFKLETKEPKRLRY